MLPSRRVDVTIAGLKSAENCCFHCVRILPGAQAQRRDLCACVEGECLLVLGRHIFESVTDEGVVVSRKDDEQKDTRGRGMRVFSIIERSIFDVIVSSDETNNLSSRATLIASSN